MMWASAIITASVGVPVTEKRRLSWRRSRTGWVRVSEWPAPDCSSVGATTQMSSRESLRDRFEQLEAAGVDRRRHWSGEFAWLCLCGTVEQPATALLMR